MPRTIDAAGWTAPADVLGAISRQTSAHPDASWLLAMDADLDVLRGRYPRPDDLDHASGGHPVLIADFSLHRSLLSTAALRALSGAGFSGSADIDRRAGQPTGMVWESAHAAALRMALEGLSPHDQRSGPRGTVGPRGRASSRLRHHACHDPCVPPSLLGELEALRKRSPLRLSWSMVAESGMLDPAAPSELCGCCGEGPASAKLFMDGAHRCALCLEPGHVLQMMGRAATAAFRGDMRLIAGLTTYGSVYQAGKFHMPYKRLEARELARRLATLAGHGVRPKIHAVGNHAAAAQPMHWSKPGRRPPRSSTSPFCRTAILAVSHARPQLHRCSRVSSTGSEPIFSIAA